MTWDNDELAGIRTGKQPKMSELRYRTFPAISRSELWKMSESPEKFKFYQDNPQPATPALIMGQTVHKLILEPETFNDEFAVIPDIDRRTKAGKEEMALFVAENEDKTIIDRETYETASRMRDAVLSVPIARRLLKGEHEIAYFWNDDVTGVPCKCRLDALTEVKGKPIIVDVKSATKSDTESFMREALKYGYDLQTAMYTEGAKSELGTAPDFIFIVVEKTAPYSVNILRASEDFYTHGYDRFREYIGMYKECSETGVWWGYLGASGIINELTLPPWMATTDEE